MYDTSITQAIATWLGPRQSDTPDSSHPRMGFLNNLTLMRAYEIAKATAVASRRWKGNTWRTYFYSVRMWESHGVRLVSELTHESVGRFKTARLTVDEVGPGSVNGDVSALLSIFDEIETQGEQCDHLIKLLRSARIKTRRPKARRAEFLSRRQVDVLCASARELEPRAEFPILVCVWSGVRLSELARMRREDFKGLDSDKPVLVIEELPELGDDGWAKTGPRTVPVCRELKAIVLAQGPPSGYLFPPGRTKNPRGIKSHRPYLSGDALWRDLKRIRTHAKMPWVSWNTLRHTRASWWAQAGASRTLIAEWLGNSEEICEQYYIGLPQAYHPDCEKAPPPERTPWLNRIPTPPTGTWAPS
jgi:integrase